jgi:hypothetical protein
VAVLVVLEEAETEAAVQHCAEQQARCLFASNALAAKRQQRTLSPGMLGPDIQYFVTLIVFL